MNRQFVYGVLIGVALVLVWYYYHTHCAACQKRSAALSDSWTRLKNRLGSRMIEPPPGGIR